MSCQFHPDKPVVASCRECGALICEACAVELNEKTICKQCVERLYKERRPDRDASKMEHHKRERFVSPFLVFLFSMLPGAAHMYMGLMKRGVFIMCAFFLSTALASYASGLTGLIIPIVFFMNFFDANNIRRKINSGERVEDQIDSIKDFIGANKKVFVVLGSLCVLSIIFDEMREFMGHYRFAAGRNVLPYVLLGAGIYFIAKHMKRRDREKPTMHIDANDLESNNGERDK